MLTRAVERSALALAAGTCGWLAVRSVLHHRRYWEFRDRVVMITGASRGLGLLLARQLADAQAHLAICARDEQELAIAANELRGRGARVHAQTCDIRQPAELEQFVASTRRELGPVDVLINNAGVIQVGPLERLARSEYIESLETHFWACLNLIEAVLPDMRRSGGGRIVNIASIGGKVAIPHLVPYCAGKFALVGLSRGLRSHLANEGIYVTTVCPGLMRTGSYKHAWFKGQRRHEFTWFSLGATLPGISMDAQRAAEQILSACQRGQAEITLSLPAKVAAFVQAAAPELTAELLALTAHGLPGADNSGGHRPREGRHLQPLWPFGWLTALGERAARANNELTQTGHAR